MGQTDKLREVEDLPRVTREEKVFSIRLKTKRIHGASINRGNQEKTAERFALRIATVTIDRLKTSQKQQHSTHQLKVERIEQDKKLRRVHDKQDPEFKINRGKRVQKTV